MRRAAQVIAGTLLVFAPVWVLFVIGRPLVLLLALAVLGVLFLVLDVEDDPHPEPSRLDRLDGRR